MMGSRVTRRDIGLALIMAGLAGLLVMLWVVFAVRTVAPPKDGASQVVTRNQQANRVSSKAVPYTVPAHNPKFISIDTLGIQNARIIKLGTKNNQIVSPANVKDVGWYQSSKKPDEEGTMFLYGHLSSWTNDGVFSNLKNIKPDDTIRVARGDNRAFTYKVLKTKKYSVDSVDMDEVLRPVEGTAHGLSLMTCAGKFDAKTKEFSERLVVFAIQE